MQSSKAGFALRSIRAHHVERLRENLADSNEKLFKNLCQELLDGPIAGHVLVQISRFRKSFSAKSAKFSRNRSTIFRGKVKGVTLPAEMVKNGSKTTAKK
jgi:hypothetical protein